MVKQDNGQALQVFNTLINERLEKYLYSIQTDEIVEEMRRDITKVTEDFMMENPGFCEYANQVINHLPYPDSLGFTIGFGNQIVYINAKNPHSCMKERLNHDIRRESV